MIHRNTEPFPIYDSILFDIIIADDNEEIDAVLEPKDRDGEYFACATKTYFKKDENSIPVKSVMVIFNTNAGELAPVTPKIIVHEAVHVKNMVFLTIGHKNTTKGGGDEPEAYFVEWIFGKISEELEIYNKLRDERQNHTTSNK